MSIVIDKEFQALIPPLQAEEYAQLEANIKADGCRDALVVWDGILVDGHNRYEICTRLGIEFETVAMDFYNRDDAKLWIAINQLGRRNLSDFSRAELALICKPILAAKAKARQERKPANSVQANLPEQDLGEVRDEIAALSGVSARNVSKVESIVKTAAPELLAAVRSGEISINAASEVTKLSSDEQRTIVAEIIAGEQPASVLRNHRAIGTGENEWYTPSEYIEMARDVMGGIDLDPASSEAANKIVKAKKYFTEDDDGLKQVWKGRLYVNPPYSRDLMPSFVEKLKQSFADGKVTQAILLSHNNSDTAWFHSLAEVSSVICFPKKRIKFYRGDEVAAPTNGQTFFYLGDNAEKFISVFCKIGLVVTPV